MSEIPTDVLKTAADAVADGWAGMSLTRSVARAILAERERCAEIANDEQRTATDILNSSAALAASRIQAAIRSGK